MAGHDLLRGVGQVAGHAGQPGGPQSQTCRHGLGLVCRRYPYPDVRNPQPSRGWIDQPAFHHDLGGWPWVKRVEASPWSKERGVTVSRVLDVVAQWPGITMSQCRQMLGEGPTGRGADAAMKTLREHRFVDRIQNGRATHYFPTSRGINCLVRRDRTKTTTFQ